jgi:zeaxanthin glucosyltransferase
MKVAFVSVPAWGHLNPTSTLARRLEARGNDVVFISFPFVEPFARASQLQFFPYGEKMMAKLPELAERLSRSHGIEGVELTWRALADSLNDLGDDLIRVLREVRADAVVLDEGQPGLGLVPLHLDMPYATISNAFHQDFTGNTPFYIFDWPHYATPEAITRNRDGLQKMKHIFEPSRVAARTYAEKLGLDRQIDWNDPYALNSKRAWLTQSPKEFDFPSSHWPSQFHYTGPFHDGTDRINVDFPWDRLTGEPLIYASMGTAQTGLESVFNTIAEAVGSQSRTQLVLSLGSMLKPETIKSLPSNAIVVSNAPQQELLRRSTLCITHAGLNTTLESLMHGVPMVAIPVTNDQPGNAAKIAHTKTGAFVPVTELSTGRLSSLIDQVMSDPEYRQNAAQMKKIIKETNGLEMAIDLLEKAFSLPSKRAQGAVQ